MSQRKPLFSVTAGIAGVAADAVIAWKARACRSIHWSSDSPVAASAWASRSRPLVGAHALAAALRGAGDDHRAAFARYEERMRPFVALNQALAVENPGGPASEESVDRAKRALALED